MHDPRFTFDLRELPGILSRTVIATPRRVLAASIALVVLMGVATGVFARAYHEAEQRRAREEFLEGKAAAALGRSAEALEHYRASLALDRDNPAPRRALAIALLSLRRTAEAETHLTQLLERDPVDGETNLLLARIAASRGAFDETEAFYQRAIYGRWAEEPEARRVAARFELIEWLVQVGALAPARAELLRVQAELPDVPLLQRQLADRWMALDQPAQAAAILQRELARRPTDASVAADLAKAEMAAGRFVEARNAARRALALNPRDKSTRDRLDQINQALALDPSQRGLTPAERFQRSQRLLRRVHDNVEACLAGRPATGRAEPGDLAALMANAELLLANEQSLGAAAAPEQNQHTEQNPTSEQNRRSEQQPTIGQKRTRASADATSGLPPSLTLQARTDVRQAAAEALWAARVARCGPSPGPLAWIFDRLSR